VTTYRLFPSTNGPASASAYTGGYIAGTNFTVTQGGMWFEGYWWWCCASGQQQNPVTCALWSCYQEVGVVGEVIAGSVVTSGELTAGAWNYIPLPTPIPIAIGDTLVAAVGMQNSFPDTNGYWGTGGAGVNGISNGPLLAYSDTSGAGGTNPSLSGLAQGLFSTAGSDPSTILPGQGNGSFNSWVDVQVSDTAPDGYTGSYRCFPNKAGQYPDCVVDNPSTFTLATEFTLTQPCQIDRIWFCSMPGESITQLPTDVNIWTASGLSGTSLYHNGSPAWSGAAGSGWVSSAVSALTLQPGTYRVSVYNGAAPGSGIGWSIRLPAFWVAGYPTTTAPNGIRSGPLFAPGDTQVTDESFILGGGGTTTTGQGMFVLGGAGGPSYPNEIVQGYAGMPSNANIAENFHIDLEVTPVPVMGTAAGAETFAGAATGTASPPPPIARNLPNVSGYPWATAADITEVDASQLDQTILADCIQAATDILFQLSGRQYAGAGSDTVRPLPRIIIRDHGRPIATTSMWNSPWGWGYYSGGYMSGFGYSRWGWITTNQEELPDGTTIPSIDLGAFPITSVTEVLVNGSVVDQTTYRVDDFRHLVRVINPSETPDDTDNPGWPSQQRMDLPVTEDNTFQVSYTYGILPPRIGIMACAELAYQLYLAVAPSGPGQSKLPQRVTSITRQGMTAAVLDPQIFLAEGRTGLIRCDYFLESINPGKLQRRATVMTPDINRRVRRTGPVN
jgi:hypothetical protein